MAAFRKEEAYGLRIKRSAGDKAYDTFNVLFMLCLAFVTVYPFWYILVYSFNEGRDAAMGGLWFWPRKWTLQNYKYVLGNPYITNAFLVTIARTVIGSIIHMVVTGFAAYTLMKKDLPGRKAIVYFYMMPMFIGGTLVSSYLVNAKLGLLNNFFVYIIPGAFSFFMMLVIRTFFEGIPESLEESAMLDGAGYYTIFFRIYLPLSGPIIAATVFFSAVGHWLDYYTNLLYVSDKHLYTLQYVLYKVVVASETSDMYRELQESGRLLTLTSEQQVTTQGLKMATLVIVTFPVLFVYPFFQKYFTKGVLVGAVKA